MSDVDALQRILAQTTETLRQRHPARSERAAHPERMAPSPEATEANPDTTNTFGFGSADARRPSFALPTEPFTERIVRRLKLPLGQAALCAGSAAATARESLALLGSQSGSLNGVQLAQHLFASAALVAAAAVHGKLLFAERPQNDNLVLWRAIFAGAALGVGAADALQILGGGSRVLLENESLTPLVVLPLIALAAATVGYQAHGREIVASLQSDGEAFLSQGLAVYSLATSTQTYFGNLGAACAYAFSNEPRPSNTQQQWRDLLKHPAGAFGMAALLGVATLMAIAPQVLPGGPYKVYWPAILQVACAAAIYAANRTPAAT